ncbi:MAG: ABC transporter substrate-binding protein [Hyphomicrobiaceae bacterium]|nr:ABC transporter substrate-binding protein [Hyphomicrobiaceae bacterium]
MRWSNNRAIVIAWTLCVMLACYAMSVGSANAQAKAEAAPPPVTIAILLSSDKEECYDRGDTLAARRLATIAQEKINARGGIHGRRLELRFLDDERDDDAAVTNVRAALATPNLLAMIGLSSSTRGKEVFAKLGKEIGASGVPFISHISVAKIFRSQPNVFSTRPSQEDERVPVMTAFIRQMGFGSVAFIGRQDAAYANAIGDALVQQLGPKRMSGDFRLLSQGKGKKLRLMPSGLEAAISRIKSTATDLVVVSVGSTLSASVIEKLKDAKGAPAVLLVGNLDRIPASITSSYPNAFYQLTWDRLPELDHDAVRNVVTRSNPEDWIFSGRKFPGYEGWTDGECKAGLQPEPFSRSNLRAIGLGAQFADMVNLVSNAALSAANKGKLDDMRKAVIADLGTTYAAGRSAFRGTFQNWSFHPKTRVRAQTPFVVILPQGLGRTQLAPIQFIRGRSGALRRIDTLYLDIDLIRAHGIDNNQKSFFADFYLAMHGNDRIGIRDLDFTNAFIDPQTNGPHLTIQVIHPGGKSDAYPESMRIYRVSGRFRFQPDFAAYPFDAQRFSIDIQPKSSDKSFVVQPPPLQLRDKSVTVDGWTVTSQYVSYIDDHVPVVDAYTHQPSIVPFYQTRFVWQMKRETTDYYLRVLVPLAFILIVAYLSIFIPQGHLEAIVTIQITALLSAVALYLSLPQVDSDTATVSDRIFVLDYLMVSLMIVISILRINVRVSKLRWLNTALTVTHVILIPLLVIATVAVILRALPAELPGLASLGGLGGGPASPS